MKKPVMVVGGGIAGIQAATDLAEMGIPVFLVEKSPSIGGAMAQLDKTFPTNDCSACILAPKVTECFSHPLVKTLTLSDVIEVKGEPPNLTAVIKSYPRYVDEAACKGCDDCVTVCPVTSKSEFDMGIGERKAIYKPFAQAVPNKVAIDKLGSSPCKFNCPAKLDANGYVTLISEGRYDEALKVVRRTTPFAGVLGRVCFHPCETNCSRQYVDDPLSIASLKRFIADYERVTGATPVFNAEQSAVAKEDKIAIIGAGPAGVNCAYQLALAGYKPDIFEKLPSPGGMLKYGIPSYRLDKDVLSTEIDFVKNLGVNIHTGLSFGVDITFKSLQDDGYKAVFLAVGAQKDLKLGIAGKEHKNVISSIDFLRDLNANGSSPVSGKVVVIGGGNVAMDAARSAKRLGCEVTIVYRRTKAEMPANEWEVHHAQEEGINILELATPIAAEIDGNMLVGLKCVQNTLGPRGKDGRRSPIAVPDSEFIVPANNIIAAIGQTIDDNLIMAVGTDKLNKWGTLSIDSSNMQLTGLEGVFAGGDATRGPATLIEAIADGNRVAASIRNYLEGTHLPIEPEELPQTPLELINTSGFTTKTRAKMPLISLDKRMTGFEEVELGLSEDLAREEASRCVNCSHCCECKLCVEACKSDAIRHYQFERQHEIPVSAVVLAPGYEVSDEIPPELGYKRYEDVVTSLEYERILSASGPYQGHVQRPSDGKEPKRIAFIQCVGSRDCHNGGDYCSAVCCMYAVKEAQITKEHLPSVEKIDIYYMDMRAYGKDFDRYVHSAQTKYEIGFIRSRIGEISKNPVSGDMLVKHCNEDGAVCETPYDLIVLSVGIKPTGDSLKLYDKLGINSDRYGFIYNDSFSAPETTRQGILACGAAAGPKDIPETVVEASAAAAGAARISNFTKTDLYNDYADYFKPEPYVPERDVSKEPIRIGVFVCHCGINIGGYVDVPKVVEFAKTLPFVTFSEESLYTCSVDAQKTISERIDEYKLNRIVVASCTPRTHEPLFQSVLKRTGLNPYLLNMANIRDQCSWVHMDDKDSATAKAKALVSMAVAKVTNAKQLKRKKIGVDKSALIIGGGAAGLSAADELSAMGFNTYLIEKSDKLGGNALNLHEDSDGRPVSSGIRSLIHKVENDSNTKVYKNSSIVSIDGYIGNFKTVVSTSSGEIELSHGVVIVAIGAAQLTSKDYLYGQSKRVVTHFELEQKLSESRAVLKGGNTIVMIQCVDSRIDERMYCSRVCCNQAIRNAIKIKKEYPKSNVVIMSREVRSYGVSETDFRKARALGVQFVRFDDNSYPNVEERGNRLIVQVYDPLLRQNVEYIADLVSLSSAITPDIQENQKIAQMLKIPLTQDGFFMEAHAKLRPVDFATEGVYLAGLAHSPKNLKESIVQGKAAASRAATVISKDQLETEGTIASADYSLCVACGACEKVCAYKAIEVDEVTWFRQTVKKAVVNDVLCKGCGTCSATCRSGAIDVGGFSDAQVISELEYLLRGAPAL